LRARMNRRQTIRRLEIIVIVAVVVVSLAFGFYLALNAGGDPRSKYDNQPVSTKDLADLYRASVAAYGTPGSAYLSDVHTLPGPAFTANGEPILVYVGADYCPFCASQRYSMIMALNRFGNFTGLEYMTSGLTDGDISTFTFSHSSYHSNYVAFQPFETYDRSDSPLTTLPTNYTSTFQQDGKNSFPFLNFADEYYISGALVDYGLLSNLNQSQIISSIQAGNTIGSQIRQAANVITAIICKTTNLKPASVCGQDSIAALTGTLSYSPPSANSGSELVVSGLSFVMSSEVAIAGLEYIGRN